jgi:hypothetical protein
MPAKLKLSALVAISFASASLSLGSYAQTGDAQKGAAPKAAAKAAAKGPQRMSFFVTSAGPGKGADLGGLAGADKQCQSLAQAAGAGNRTWRAYLSTTAEGGAKAVNARDRIGRGPWYNAKGVLIARTVDELHMDNKITKQTALTEKGTVVNGVGDKPTMHDMLTGSDSQGRAFPVGEDTTCGNWTKSTAGAGSAQLGHSDRTGLTDNAPSHSWNMAHPSRGCSQDNLIRTGGNGFFYCFAVR